MYIYIYMHMYMCMHKYRYLEWVERRREPGKSLPGIIMTNLIADS